MEPTPEAGAQAEAGPIPSGPWHGFWTYSDSSGRHRQDLHLTFREGRISGDGLDEVGRSLIRGRYEEDSLQCRWTKTYPGSHDVFYSGAYDLGSIWGTWEIPPHGRGGFRIWPGARGEGAEVELEEEEPVEAEARAAAPAPPRRISSPPEEDPGRGRGGGAERGRR
ncbi:MAG: hypothetical protein L0216_17925 [Planctomycetales bacterium]|nr:hypothetical protein [Planctomycetales bacterium]